MMTPGDKRWIKNWKPKGVNMNPTKTKPAKKKPAKRRVVSAEDFAKRNPVLSKLLDLKYRINEAYRSGKYDDAYNDTQVDKSWVMSLINDVRHNSIKKLSREDGLKCNSIWRKYERK